MRQRKAKTKNITEAEITLANREFEESVEENDTATGGQEHAQENDLLEDILRYFRRRGFAKRKTVSCS